MRIRPLCLLVPLLACDGASVALPAARAPVQPLPSTPITPTIEGLVALGETSISGTPGSTVTVQVKAFKVGGAGVPNTAIFFRVVSGGGVVQPLTPATDATGVATAKWTLGSQPATNLLTALVGSVSPVTFTAVVVPASAP